MPMLLEEFPYLHLSEHTWHELWRKGIQQIENLTHAYEENKRRKNKAHVQVRFSSLVTCAVNRVFFPCIMSESCVLEIIPLIIIVICHHVCVMCDGYYPFDSNSCLPSCVCHVQW